MNFFYHRTESSIACAAPEEAAVTDTESQHVAEEQPGCSGVAPATQPDTIETACSGSTVQTQPDNIDIDTPRSRRSKRPEAVELALSNMKEQHQLVRDGITELRTLWCHEERPSAKICSTLAHLLDQVPTRRHAAVVAICAQVISDHIPPEIPAQNQFVAQQPMYPIGYGQYVPSVRQYTGLYENQILGTNQGFGHIRPLSPVVESDNGYPHQQADEHPQVIHKL